MCSEGCLPARQIFPTLHIAALVYFVNLTSWRLLLNVIHQRTTSSSWLGNVGGILTLVLIHFCLCCIRTVKHLDMLWSVPLFVFHAEATSHVASTCAL